MGAPLRTAVTRVSRLASCDFTSAIPTRPCARTRRSILYAFAAVGDGRVIRDIERVAADTRSETVRAAAERTLAAIRARIAEANDAAHLLRPASSPEAETLLRPACGPGEADADVLLRPSEANGESRVASDGG